jgi:DNA replication and repair protein RecF
MSKISQLILTNFRNFLTKKINFSKELILFVGKNGAGKTNILESLTLLGRSTSLRGSDFETMILNSSIDKKFSVFAQISNCEFIEKIAVSFDLAAKKKILQINGEPFSSKRQSDVKNYLINFISLTPTLEQLFILGKSERRNYLDKIVCDLNLEHNNHVNNYQKALRERLLILQKYRGQKTGEKWLDIVEANIVELGVAIAFARIEAVDFFNKALNSFTTNFPKPKLKIIGEVENMIAEHSAIQLEEFYKNKLKENRTRDLENFKTDFGVHRCDFDAIFVEKNMSATLCSTGEQKAIMISITLARAKISATYKNQPTILIFDEIVSHLDEKRKSDLLEEVSAANLQTFLSATTANLIPQEFLKKDLIEVFDI